MRLRPEPAQQPGNHLILLGLGQHLTQWNAGPRTIPKDTSVAVTCDRYGHLLPEVDKQAATKLEAAGAATRLAGLIAYGGRD